MGAFDAIGEKLKQFVPWNQWTKKALKCKTEKEFKELCLQCFQETAKESGKDIKDISLEDVYRVLHAVRKRTPEVLRKITLKQALDLKTGISNTSDLFNVIYGVLAVQPSLLLLVGLKKVFGKRAEFALKIHIVSLIARALYKPPAEDAPKKKKAKK